MKRFFRLHLFVGGTLGLVGVFFAWLNHLSPLLLIEGAFLGTLNVYLFSLIVNVLLQKSQIVTLAVTLPAKVILFFVLVLRLSSLSGIDIGLYLAGILLVLPTALVYGHFENR